MQASISIMGGKGGIETTTSLNAMNSSLSDRRRSISTHKSLLKKSVLAVISIVAGNMFSQALAAEEAYTEAYTQIGATEKAFSSWVYQVKADKVHAQNITGKGATIGILDTGLDSANAVVKNELDTRVVNAYDAIIKKAVSNTAYSNKHGTMVAGFIAASANGSGIYGIAPNANITPIRILGDNGSGTETYWNTGIKYAVSKKIKILNASLGASGEFGKVGLMTAVNSGAVVVIAAGNSGGSDPQWPARYAKEKWANGQVIAVGAVDSNNVIASFSNRAGDTKDYFLVAPGVNLVSTCGSASPSGLCMGSGTSFAAPIVSGVAGLIQSNWSYLTAKQTADILFKTATDLGAAGTDAIYGRGMVNAEKALSPIGNVYIKTATSATNVKKLSSTASIASGNALKTAKAKVTGFDEFGRNYTYKLADNINQSSSAILGQLINDSDQSNIADRMLSKNFSVQYNELGNELGMRLSTADGMRFNVGSNNMAKYAYGAGAANAPQLTMAADLTKNPYSNLVSEHSHLFVGQQLSNGWSSNLGVLSNQFDDHTSGKTLGMFELTKQSNDYLMSANVSTLTESASALGGTGSKSLGFGGEHTTNSVGFSGAYAINKNLVVAGNFTTGVTKNNTSDAMLNANNAISQSWALGAFSKDVLNKDDRLSLSMSSPLAYVSGNANLYASVGVDEQGNAMMGNQQVTLVPDARELRFEMKYSTNLTDNSKISINAMSRLNPGNDATQDRDDILMFKYTLRN